MKIDLQSMSAEPLIYMLMHSGAFVTVLGIVFFLIGLLFGRATWGRYKRQTVELRGEAATMKEEIADLKRKLGEYSMKAGPAVSIVTETIQMPKREAPPERNAVEKKAVAAPAAAPVTDSPSRPAGHVIKSRSANTDVGGKDNGATAPPRPTEPGAPAPAPAPAEAPQPAESRPASPLAAIISHPPTPKSEGSGSLAHDIPTLPEILPSGKVAARAEVRPEMDPQLGLIYKARPEHADDLTALKGVARGLEQRLHALGVYTYEQMAGWTGEQVREFSARLSFKDRILREQWVEQARELQARKLQRVVD